MKTKPLPSQAELSKLLRYDPETGRLFWRPQTGRVPQWNTMFADKEAFTYVNSRGYRCGRIRGQDYKAHRVVWKLVHGAEPEYIDHIDGDQLNNRIGNLRSVSHGENMKNQKRHSTNRSGYAGVHWHSEERIWRATIRVDGKLIYLGSYLTAEEAGEVRRHYATRFGFHANHGR